MAWRSSATDSAISNAGARRGGSARAFERCTTAALGASPASPCVKSDCLTERVRRRLQTITYLSQFTRRQIDAFLLHVRARPLAHSLLDKALQLLLHVLHDVGEVSELTRDQGHVRVFAHVTAK
jgi:hypothetical protein